MTDPAGQYRLPGRALLASVIAAYRPYRALVARAGGASVVVVRFEPSVDADPAWQLRMDAARISAEQKHRVFTRLGARPVVHVLPDTAPPAQLAERLEAASADPAVPAIIVQTPLPRRLLPLLDTLPAAKDIDALGLNAPGRAGATSDGVVRILAPFLTPTTTVAVVGGRGMVGSGVVALLRRRGVDPVVLDIGDDLAAVGRADVVVSSSGRAQLLTAEHLHPGHRLVVDTGFVPLPAGAVGDVHPAARGIPAAITPVPGGVGPVEMAVLAERLLTTLVAPDLAPWRYLGPAAPSVTDVAQTVADQRARARPTGGGAGPSVPGPAAPGRSAPGPTTPGPAPGRRGEPPGPPASGPRRR